MSKGGWRKKLQDLFLKILSLIYRVQVRGVEDFPEEGQGVLLVSNHVSYVDVIVLQMACPRMIRFLSFAEFFKRPLLGSILRWFQAIPISPRQAKDAVIKAAEALQQGDVICIFPEGQLTLTGDLQEFQKGFELIARRAQVPVLPVHLGSLWDSLFSHQGGRSLWKGPRHFPFDVQVTFGKPLPFMEANAVRVRQEVIELGKKGYE
jgi:acyl-[acyl-carrier-protein]-phospholipid O-acyltransferase / long-chain-fatty-acid--[acyl-carrier-protein] ligase